VSILCDDPINIKGRLDGLNRFVAGFGFISLKTRPPEKSQNIPTQNFMTNPMGV
jgi:hypothetical protein